MPSTKKLLSITNLKKYFPIAKNSIFQRERLYVRANEEITLDIHDGEISVISERDKFTEFRVSLPISRR